MITWPKLDSPSGFVKSPLNTIWEEFATKYPKVDIFDPLHEGNGLWIAKWLSPRGAWTRHVRRGGEGLQFFAELEVIMAEQFPDDPSGASSVLD